MSATRLIQPVSEPLHLSEVRAHLRIDGSLEDTQLAAFLAAARVAVEADTGRALMCQQWSWSHYAFPEVIELPVGPVIQLVDIRYRDAAGDIQTLISSAYQVDTLTYPARIYPAYGTLWPVVRGDANSVQVRYYAGYATACTFAPDTNRVTAIGRPLIEGETFCVSNSGGVLPAPLTSTATYTAGQVTNSYNAYVNDGNGNTVDLLDAGTGLHLIGCVPPNLLAAMKLMAGHLYENRELTNVGMQVNIVPRGYEALVWMDKHVRVV